MLSRKAAKLGLQPGLMLAEARARVPGLAVQAHDPQADAALLGKVVKLCGRYTPSVAPHPPLETILDITGCAHLHGGEEALQADLIVRIRNIGLTAQSALATTPDAARALARFGGNDIHALPIAALKVESETRQALRRAGFRRIGDLAELPRAPLAARFGSDLVRLLARLLAEEDPHIVPHHSPEPIREEMRFAEPIRRTQDMLDAIEMLAARAMPRLAERDEGARALAVRLHRSDGHIAGLLVETGAPTRDPALLLRLLQERIDNLADPLDPGFGYDSVEIAIPHAEALAQQQEQLEPESVPSPDIGPLLDRLAVRHGPSGIMCFAAGDSHVPERAGILHPFHTPLHKQAGWLPILAGDPPSRPLLLFDPPQRLQVIAAVPDGPPRQFRWRGGGYRVVRQEGPERIAPEWWRRRDGHSENPGLSRDYYRVEDDRGHRFWLFRHGLYERETGDPHWYLHGLFA